MKKLLVVAIISLSSFSTAALAEIKVGIILGFTGPIESLTPTMAGSAEMAFKEASDSGKLLKHLSDVSAIFLLVDLVAEFSNLNTAPLV